MEQNYWVRVKPNNDNRQKGIMATKPIKIAGMSILGLIGVFILVAQIGLFMELRNINRKTYREDEALKRMYGREKPEYPDFLHPRNRV